LVWPVQASPARGGAGKVAETVEVRTPKISSREQRRRQHERDE
jgi:hypothetical protein